MIDSYGVTDKGRRRQLNQDRVFVSDGPVGLLPNLYIVADGMGGHNAGELASAICVRVIQDELKSLNGVSPEVALETAIKAANSAIWGQAQTREGCKGMGTTVVACTCLGDDLLVANVGDSRAYICSDEMQQVSVDHSLVEEMVQMGGLERSKARNHPDKNIITRAVGAMADIDVDLFRVSLEKDDVIMLCSDGMTNMVDDETIGDMINSEGTLRERAHRLVDMANENGGRDNISVILIEPFAGQ
ncbi:MAG: Stp1/IreP family PP2C-type Ser/Thr phosphatase [Lachnospiraceae bacterium]|nr:Stp1/IreP family PP2C-type Ser/Thr phosphatase [Lachnospiraceae bacterium]